MRANLRATVSAILRHTAHQATVGSASSAAHKGISLDKLQVVLGHADIATTRLYVQASGLEVAEEMAGVGLNRGNPRGPRDANIHGERASAMPKGFPRGTMFWSLSPSWFLGGPGRW
jgi:hypothetical protein